MALLEYDVSGSRPKKSLQKPLLLKDFLLDDLNSCSSSGFRSYPRRQCCTSVRFLLEIDLTARNESQTGRKNLLPKSRSKTAQSTTMSALQRASEAVINAVKYFPFAGLNPKKAILPRSFSRKISKRSFWKKKDHHKEIKRWKSFRELLQEQPEPLSISPPPPQQPRPGKDLKKQLDAGVKGNLLIHVWAYNEKEQLSPVSVLDFPDDDDDDEVSSPFRCWLSRAEGTGSKQKLMRKSRRFENLSQLQPVDLESRIAQSECDQKPVDDNARQTEQNAVELLEEMKATIPPASFTKYNLDKLLLHFFGERIAEGYTQPELFSSATDWINGHPQELLLEWEEQKNREAYMEKGRKWEEVDEEKQEVGSELEAEIFTCLVNELLLDLFAA
ncbi:hypothetical protein RJ639_042344 [Escallonia herrerae]|uniref:DUF4378 domain-containing protein n=1 Tax=Escallonia herrerae TaxID=1293975 RepID=A0AA88WU34_9ASTE|nr:hypothetical protein RJ639_042344 [Escallonia herrerae]